MKTTTKTDDREQWRARILRALAELQTDIPGLEAAVSDQDGGRSAGSAFCPSPAAAAPYRSSFR
jgi:hypothetical protein